MTLDAVLRPGALPPPQSVWVAKVGITENPAERLCDIFNAFQEFGKPQPLLRSLSRNDNPQTAVAKAKSMNGIIFIEKVHTPRNAERDIRVILEAGDLRLPQEFFDSFAASVPQEKKGYLDVVGMTEWIMMKNGLADMLQQKFRGGGIYELGLFPGKVPNGEELTHAVNEFCGKCHKIASSRGPTRESLMGAGGPPPPLVITFIATNFTYIHYKII